MTATVQIRRRAVAGLPPWPQPARPGWEQSAACATRAEPWWSWAADTPADTAHARLVCATCPVQGDCLATALGQDHDHWDIWGGLTPPERHRMRRHRHLLQAHHQERLL